MIFRISRNSFLNNPLFKFLGLPFLLILFVENGRKWKNHQFSSRKIIISIIKFLKNPRRDHPDPAPDGRDRGRGYRNMAGRGRGQGELKIAGGGRGRGRELKKKSWLGTGLGSGYGKIAGREEGRGYFKECRPLTLYA